MESIKQQANKQRTGSICSVGSVTRDNASFIDTGTRDARAHCRTASAVEAHHARLYLRAPSSSRVAAHLRATPAAIKSSACV